MKINFRLVAAKLGSSTAKAALSVADKDWQNIKVESQKYRSGNIITIGERRYVQGEFCSSFNGSKDKKESWGELKNNNEVHQVWPISESALTYINLAAKNR